MDRIIEFSANHPLLVMGFVAVLLVLLWTEVMRRLRGIPELAPAEAVPWINDPEAVVIDISSSADFNRGHIVNSRNLPASRLAQPDAEVQKLKDRKLLVVCKSGQSAVAAAQSLRKMGAERVAVLKGGITQWRSEQFPVTSKK